MRHKSLYMMCLFCILTVALYGCSMQSEEDALQNAVKRAENVFESKEKIDTNEQIDDFQFYLPQTLTMEEESKNNIILSNGDESYIVFYNNLEKPKSKLNYESAKDSKALVYESFEDENKFGYIQVLPGNDKKYQIQVGVGGVKISTYTTKTDLEKEAKELMKIACSIMEGENQNL